MFARVAAQIKRVSLRRFALSGGVLGSGTAKIVEKLLRFSYFVQKFAQPDWLNTTSSLGLFSSSGKKLTSMSSVKMSSSWL